MFTSIAIRVPVDVIGHAFNDATVQLNGNDGETHRSRTAGSANTCVVEGGTVGAVSVGVHLECRGVKPRGVADAEHLGSTVVATTGRPGIFGKGVGHELPAGDAAQVGASAEHHDEIVGWHQARVEFGQIFEVANLIRCYDLEIISYIVSNLRGFQLRNSRRKNGQVFSLYPLVEKTREGWRG